MRRWFIGTNNFYFVGSIYLEEAPWYIFALESGILKICDYFPRIPLPKIKIVRENEKTTLREWYGSTHDLFHIFICSPITDWCYKKIEIKSFSIPYEMIKEKFPKEIDNLDIPFDDDFEKNLIEENKKYSELIGSYFKEAYIKLKKIPEERGCKS